MTTAEVIKIREFLRISRKRTVYTDDSKQTSMTVDDLYPICVEVDNTWGFSEEADIILWDDANELMVIITSNNFNVRGAQPVMGRDKPLNPVAVMVVDYSEIQGMKMVLDEYGLRAVMQKAVTNGVKASINGKEVVVDASAIDRAVFKYITQSDPAYQIKKDNDMKYS